MLGSFKRRRIEAAGERYNAAQRLITALKEANAALDALKVADDRFYKAGRDDQITGASELRQSRERMYAFHIAAELVGEAPRLARLLEVRGGAVGVMPFAEFIAHTSKLDLPAEDQPQGA